MSGAIHLLPLYAFMAWTEPTLLYFDVFHIGISILMFIEGGGSKLFLSGW
jgi:hypothetical protein